MLNSLISILIKYNDALNECMLNMEVYAFLTLFKYILYYNTFYIIAYK